MTFHFSGFKGIRQQKSLERLAQRTCARVPRLKGSGEINFILVKDGDIKRIHKRFLNDPSATDVITFHYADAPMKRVPAGAPFADIYISKDTAARQARRGNYPAVQEIALLMVHGLLHAAGYDDRKPKDRKAMFALQKRLLSKIDPALAPPDFR